MRARSYLSGSGQILSILMDSAYYNYSREVTGRFGLVPPEPKAVFVYEGGATP